MGELVERELVEKELIEELVKFEVVVELVGELGRQLDVEAVLPVSLETASLAHVGMVELVGELGRQLVSLEAASLAHVGMVEAFGTHVVDDNYWASSLEYQNSLVALDNAECDNWRPAALLQSLLSL